MRGVRILPAAAVGLVVLLLFTPVIQGQKGWKVTSSSNKICAFKGSWVDIFTTYNNREAITSAFWFSPERSHQWQSPSQPEDLSKDSQFKGRVHVTTVRGRSTLRISDLRESDSAEYRFKFKASWFEWGNSLPGTTLTVTDLKVLVTSSPSSYRSQLECHSSCTPDPSSYIWYKNGQTFQGQKSFIYVDDTGTTNSYSCAVRGHEDSPSRSVCVKGQTCNRVTYIHRSICAPKGSSVDISCTYNSSKTITSKYWLRPETRKWWRSPSQPDTRVQALETERGSATLRISDLRESDSAEYQFKFWTHRFEWGNSLPGTTLTVTVLQVHVKRVIVYQFHTEAELECHNSCISASRLSYIWFKNGEKLIEEQSFSYRGQFYPGGTISCALKGHDAYCSPSLYALKVPSVSVSPSAEVMENSSVTLTCSSDAEAAANYTWYKRNRDSDPQPFSKESEFVFRSIKSSDSGQYYCTVENELGKRTSENIYVIVRYAPKLPSVSVSPSGDIMKNSSVTLTCSSDANPTAKYTWYKRNQKVLNKEQQLVFESIQPSDSGVYYCTAENDLGKKKSKSFYVNVKYGPETSTLSVNPSGEIVEGSSVTLTCSSDANPAANYTWYKENQILIKGPKDVYHFTSISSEDRGNYYCKSENPHGQLRSKCVFIDVKYAPKLPSVSVSPSGEIVEGSSVTLTCSSDANPAANYTWYKENQTLIQGPKGSFQFSSTSSEDRGNYYCMTENQYGQSNSSSLFLDVHYAPKLPSVSVSPSGEIVEGSSVNLTCISDANPAATYTWYKENEELSKTGQNFIITNLRAEDSGNYYCVAQNKRGHHNSTFSLTVLTGAWKSISAVSTTAVFLLIILFTVLVLIRKKKASKQSPEPEERPDYREQYLPTQRQSDDEQNDLNYASVRFYKNQEDSLYSNIGAVQHLRHQEAEDQDVDYATVQFISSNTAPRYQKSAAEDAETLYSTVNKTR